MGILFQLLVPNGTLEIIITNESNIEKALWFTGFTNVKKTNASWSGAKPQPIQTFTLGSNFLVETKFLKTVVNCIFSLFVYFGIVKLV